YSRFPEPPPGEKFQGLSLNQKLYYHKIGTPQNEDALIHERPDQPKWTIGGHVTDDGQYLVVSIGDGTTSRKSRTYYKNLIQADAKLTPLIDNFDSRNFFLDNVGTTFYFRTDKDAPRGRVVAIDLAKPDVWKEVIPQARESLETVNIVGDQIIAVYLKD